MQNSLIIKFISFLLLCPLSINSALSENIDNNLFSNQLEIILNKKKHDLLKDIFLEKSFKKFKKEYVDFKRKYKDAKWTIKTISNDPDKIFLDVKITAKREIGDQIYNLNSKQIIKIETYKNKIKSYNIINEESILNTQNSPLVVAINNPDKVRTGEKYEMNLIIEKPLDHSFIASGMIIIKNNTNGKISNDVFRVKPNQSGGLFKYIQAPLEPGSQTISAIIMHPEGIYSITKKIKVSL